MTRLTKLLHAMFLVDVCPATSNAGWFGASNFDECILESMKGVTSDTAAGAIHRACRAKYPAVAISETEAPDDVVRQLDGRASYSYGYLEGTVYNGNKSWTITQLSIVLAPKSKEKPPDSARSAKEYNVRVTVAPLTNVKFIESVANLGTADFDWHISGARGYKK